MAMQNTKRERCINWEKEEKQLFRNVLKPYLSIIENKDLSTNTNKEKTKAWDEITEKFNIANVRTRDKKQLINQWKCQKLSSKIELSLYRRETNKTGGGPKPPSPSPDTIEIVEMIPEEFEIPYNEFDCDGVKETPNKTIIFEFVEPNNIDNSEGTTKEKETKNVGSGNIINDKTEPKPNCPLTTPKRCMRKTQKTSQDDFKFAEASFNDMHHFRVLENEQQQNEHELRMKHMAEMHSQLMINLKLQAEILMQSLNKNK